MNQIVELFSNNLINCFILVLFLIYMWARLTPTMFASRKNKIESALNEAEQARLEGQEFFKKQEERIASAEEESKKILEGAARLAENMKAEIQAQTEAETKAMSERISQQIAAEYQQAIIELRSRSAIAAIKLAQAQLPKVITSSASSRLFADFVEQLDNGGMKQ